MNNDRLRQLYEQGVSQYKILEFDVQDNTNWAQTSASGLDYRNKHFDWLHELLTAMKADSKAAYTASKIIKKVKFELNPNDYWLGDNPDSLTCASIYADTKIILHLLEQYLDNAPDTPMPIHSVSSIQAKQTPIQQETTNVGKKVLFDVQASALRLGSKTCDIPDETLEHYICKFAFKNRRVAAKENDILEMTVKSQDSQRAVYDALLRVNKKARKQLGIDKLLQYKAAKIRIVGKYQ